MGGRFVSVRDGDKMRLWVLIGKYDRDGDLG